MSSKLAIMRMTNVLCLGVGLSGVVAFPALAQVASEPSTNLFGSSGLIDMPSAEHQKPGQITTSVAGYSGSTRTTLTFQITPRISGSFRYSTIDGYNSVGRDTRYDRSFDIRYRVFDESDFVPAVTIGLQDFAGTGVFSGEYIVATKTLHPSLKATAGIGWGRLGGRKGYLGRTINIGKGGVPDAGNWFRGPVQPFGGLEWNTPIEGLRLKAEYSSDAYAVEVNQGVYERKSSANFGLEYDYNEAVKFGAYYLNGNQFALMASLSFNPNDPPAPSGLESAPLPVLVRKPLTGGATRYADNWSADPASPRIIRGQVRPLLEANQLEMEGLEVTSTSATLYLLNKTFIAPAEAVGRAARALSRGLPGSIETFNIVLVEQDLPVTRVTMQRRDVESLSYDPYGAEKLHQRSTIASGPARRPEGLVYEDGRYPRFKWSITPSVRSSFFDPDAPIRIDLGVRAKASYTIAPGFTLSGSINKPLVGNLGNIKRAGGANPKVPRVRSYAARYYSEGDPALERLTADYLFKLHPDVYGRISAGYLEFMYGGVSSEILWKPANSKLALGAELNYVKQREFEQRFGFRDYDVLTGHVSAYYDMDNGFTAQLDAGRYLAGDIGATFGLNRTFNNGWVVGAFFTLTDIPFEDFGEGSFDKGITLSIPFSWGIGRPSRNTIDTQIRPLTRDGGARLKVENRLYGIVSKADGRAVSETFGRVWR
ncbi:YjbH domain-containing protein [Neptunicoccus sediminis]|uniref:YjbH domain-containing protein n=1 Tax=Neptunicoccus sediminis TaxID=1892596 RepID=UPI0009F5A904|nr:YjbH domain-containing protein [Neptunicoccus sediminis]